MSAPLILFFISPPSPVSTFKTPPPAAAIILVLPEDCCSIKLSSSFVFVIALYFEFTSKVSISCDISSLVDISSWLLSL